MDELCSENDFNYFMKYGEHEQCPETSPMAGFFMLLSIIPISFLFAMIAISQHMQITGDLEVEVEEEEEEKETPYEEKYPLEKESNTNKEPNTELLCVMENTPNGSVFMKYCLDNEGFDYWSDYKEIPFNHLETVARKYVNSFNCTDLYVREEDTSSEEEQTTDSEYSSDFVDNDEKEEENDEETKKEPEKTDSDDDIFVKFKNTEKIKETIVQEDKPINKFRYKGKLVDILEFTQKNKKEEPKNISFTTWKVF
tara:strand:+ start:950 stop:1711 length:762 start_codon:yes stop_codon:yes gene_type:complete